MIETSGIADETTSKFSDTAAVSTWAPNFTALPKNFGTF